MNKRLLAGLMAFCLAAGAANAAFAEDPPLTQSIHTEIATGETALPDTTPEPTEVPANPTPTPDAEQAPPPTETPVQTPAPATPEAAATATPETAARRAAPQRAVTLQSVSLEDHLKESGEFIAVVNGSTEAVEDATYTWYRSKTGAEGTWQEVTFDTSGELPNLPTGRPQALNAAVDTLLTRMADTAKADTDRYHYKVTVELDGKTMSAVAAVPYYAQLQNGSFEVPSVPNSSGVFCSPQEKSKRSHFLQTLHAGVKDHENICWYTTADCTPWGTNWSANKYIEIADASSTVYGHSNEFNQPNDPSAEYNIAAASDGTQFAELNCQSYGALYQDVMTVPGTTLNWSADHAGRDGTDTMALIIAPEDAAKEIVKSLEIADKTSVNGIKNALNGSIKVNGQTEPISKYIISADLTAKPGNWTTHSGEYTVPPGQYISRFFFVAVATASKDDDGQPDLTKGNMLDRVWFSADPVPPAPGKGTLALTKTLLQADGTPLPTALVDEVKEGLQFSVVKSSGESAAVVAGTDMTADPAHPNVLTKTITLPLQDDKGQALTYAVTETKPGTPPGYDWLSTRAAKGDEPLADAPGKSVSQISLNARAAVTVRFENTYAPATGALTLTKRLPEGASEALQKDFAATVNTFTVQNVAAGSYPLSYTAGAPADAPTAVEPGENGTITLQIKGAGSAMLQGLAPGSYTVAEVDAPDLTDFYLTTPDSERRKTAAVTAHETAEVTITNQYAPYQTVILTKKVAGNMGDTTKEFPFTVTVDSKTPQQAGVKLQQQAGGARLTDTGFALHHNDSVHITGLRQGQILLLTETDPGDHIPAWLLNDVEAGQQNQYRLEVPAAADGVTRVICRNTRNMDIPTGLRTRAAPYLTLLAACWLGWRLLRRREG